MRLNVLLAGDAGKGINQAADILSKVLSKKGLYIFNYRDYKSLISGGHSFNVLCISDKIVRSNDFEYDIAILLDKKSEEKHKKDFKKNCIVLKNYKGKKDSKREIFIDNSEFKKVENILFSAALLKILGFGKSILEKEIKDSFKGKSLMKLDLEAVKKAYSQEFGISKEIKKKAKNKNLSFMTGAEATGIGAIESGLDVYLAYPMTPATSLLTFLAQHQKKYNYLTFEPENEIAVANASLGTSFAGGRTMVGSSGGGFDLMAEAISMQGMTELPLVVYLAQRNGPSSGAATYTGQQDLNQALNIGHGDFPRIVMAPGDIEESYKNTKEAFYLAEKYGILSIILTDKHLAESGYSQKLKNYNLFCKKTGKYPGDNMVKANSYSHDSKGNYTEDPKIIAKMMDKRREKIKKAQKEIGKKFESMKVFGDKKSKNVVLSFGSTKGVILDSLPEIKGWKYIHVIYLEPFSKKLKKEIEKANKIKVIEVNSSGQFADLIQKNTNRKIKMKDRILRYDGRPFTRKEIIDKLK